MTSEPLPKRLVIMEEIEKIPGPRGWCSTAAKEEYLEVCVWMLGEGARAAPILDALRRLYEATLRDDLMHDAIAQRLNRR